MAKVMKCRDVGVDCDFEARGATVEEVLKKCSDHAKADHEMDEISPELVEKIMAAIHDEEG